MSVVVITPPETVVTAEEAKASGVFTADDDDDYVNMLLSIAQAQIDGPSGWLGRAIGTQTLELRVDQFGCGDIRLPYPPVVEINSVLYDDDDGEEQTVPDSDYRLVGQPSMPKVVLGYDASWPSVRLQSEAVRIQYEAGYETEDVPNTIKHAIILMAGALRDAVPDEGGFLKKDTVEGIGSKEYTVPDGAVASMRTAAGSLLSLHKVFS